MKFFVIDKYTVLTLLLVAILFAAAVPVMNSGSVRVSSEKRELPIYSVRRDDNAVCVTFDCAWGNEDVEKIAQILKANDCRATFFVLGTWAQKYPETVKMLHSAGHEIANHSYNHAYYTRLSPEEMLSDMDKCDALIEEITAADTKLFRAPAGDYNNSVVSTVQGSGRYCIQWDVDSIDYKNPTPAQMEERIMSKVSSGSIILFHTGTKNTAAALESILPKLKAAGYKFVPVGEMIYYDNYSIDFAGRQSPIPTQNDL